MLVAGGSGRPLALLSLLALLLALAPASGRMRRPWESESEAAHNAKTGNKNMQDPRRAGRADLPPHLAGLTARAQAHCTQKGKRDAEAEHSSACMLAQHGYLDHIPAFKEAGFLTAADLVSDALTCASMSLPRAEAWCSLQRPEADTAACSDERLKELGIAKLMHRKKFVGKVVEQAKQAVAQREKNEL